MSKKLSEAERSAQAWRLWAARFSAQDRAVFSQLDTENMPLAAQLAVREQQCDDRDHDWYSTLPVATQILFSQMYPETTVEADIDMSGVGYFVVEDIDEECLLVRKFRTSAAAAKRLAELDGRDGFVAIFYGIHLPFTKRPSRLLLLPDRATALTIPSRRHEPVVQLAATECGELALQDDHYIGACELAEAGVTTLIEHAPIPAPSKLDKPKTGRRQPPARDAEDDDVEDEDEDTENV